MKYRAVWANSDKSAQLVTEDEVVIEASSNMEWAVGRTLYAVFVWCAPKRILLYLIDDNDVAHLIESM